MKLTFLGTGTSTGVPSIACDCETCLSDDPRDKRLRVSILIEHENTRVLVDTSIDFRQQALRANIRHLDAVLITHCHVDHVFGLDDIRPLNFRYGAMGVTVLGIVSVAVGFGSIEPSAAMRTLLDPDHHAEDVP